MTLYTILILKAIDNFTVSKRIKNKEENTYIWRILVGNAIKDEQKRYDDENRW